MPSQFTHRPKRWSALTVILSLIAGVWALFAGFDWLESRSIKLIVARDTARWAPPWIYESDRIRFDQLVAQPLCGGKGRADRIAERCSLDQEGLPIEIELPREIERGTMGGFPNWRWCQNREVTYADIRDRLLEAPGLRKEEGEQARVKIQLTDRGLRISAAEGELIEVKTIREVLESWPLTWPERLDSGESLNVPTGTGPFCIVEATSRYQKLKRRKFSPLENLGVIEFESPPENSPEAAAKWIGEQLGHPGDETRDAPYHAALSIEAKVGSQLEKIEGPWTFTRSFRSTLVLAVAPRHIDRNNYLQPEWAELVSVMQQLARDPSFLEPLGLKPSDQMLPPPMRVALPPLHTVHERWSEHEDWVTQLVSDSIGPSLIPSDGSPHALQTVAGVLMNRWTTGAERIPEVLYPRTRLGPITLLTNGSWETHAKAVAARLEDRLGTSIEVLAMEPLEEGQLRGGDQWDLSILALIADDKPDALESMWESREALHWFTKDETGNLDAIHSMPDDDDEARRERAAAFARWVQGVQRHIVPLGSMMHYTFASGRLSGLTTSPPLDLSRLRLQQRRAPWFWVLGTVVIVALIIVSAVQSGRLNRYRMRRLQVEHLHHDLEAPLSVIRTSLRGMTQPELADVDRLRVLEADAPLVMSQIEDALDLVDRARWAADAAVGALARKPWTNRPMSELVEICRLQLVGHAAAMELDEHGFETKLSPDAARARVPGQPLARVLQNLVSNAARHRGDRPLKVKLAARVSGRRVVIEVQDWGPGIDSGEVKRIWSRGARGVSTQPQTQGSGLGLFLCRTILASMGGTIELAKPANPTTFRLSVPIGTDSEDRT